MTKEYDKNGALRKETAEDGTVTEYTYDNMNRVISRTVTKGGFSKTWTTGYDYATVDIHTGKGPSDTVRVKNAFVTTERNPDGEITSQSYQDHLGRNVRELENGIYVDMTYDGQGNVLTQYELGAEQTDDKGLLTMFIYDDAGNKTHTVLNPTYDADKGFYTRGEAIVQASTYDKSGNETSSTDGEGNTTKFTYDEEGNITSATLPDGTTTKYEYDKVNADGTTSDFTIDPLGRKSEVKKDEGDLEVEVADLGKNAPDPIKTRYQYDAKENVTRETDSEGNYRTYVYDGRDRKVAANYFDKSGKQTLKTTYEYDISDNVTLMCDYTVENGKEILLRYTKYSYDSLKRLVGMAELDGPAVPTAEEIEKHMLRYTYDIDDNLTAIDYPDTGSKVKGLRFTYNQHKWLTAVHADTGGLLDEKVRDYVYGNDGKLLQIKDYKGVLSGGLGYIQRDYTYDAFERPTGMEYKDSDNFSAARESYAYTYDKNNNILTERIINGYPEKAEEKTDQLRAHTYDSLGRLTSTTITDNGSGKAQNIAYEYDDAGNRVKEIKDGIVTDYDYNDFNQLASSQKTQGEEKLSEKTYAYDKNGNQLSETDKITGESRSMTYDAAGSLGRLVVKKGNTIELTQENLYNGNGQRIQKTEADRTTRYYYQGSSVLYTRDGMNALTSQNLLGTGDNVIATTRGAGDAESYYIYNKDVRESTSNVLDDCGQSQVSYEYDDFGETKVKGNQDFYNEICYTGGIHDASTGLYYLNARYYDPENANFLSQDTYRGEKDDPESLNLYAYCNNNPASYTDPTGHFPWVVAGIWAYRGIKAAYKGYKVYKKAKKVYKAAKTVKKTYRAAKTYRKASSTYRSARRTYKTYKKVKRTYSKPKVTKRWKRTVKKSSKPSRAKAAKKVTKKKVVKPKTKVVKASKGRKTAGCFVAGTKISTEKGFVPIEKIKEGDRVWAEDPNTGEKALKKVKKIFVREKDSLIRLAINGEVIETTEEHPFWIKDQGWIPAGSLKEGDLTKLQSGEYVPIESYEVVILDEPITVHNFHVEDLECYYVSGQRVLVHNNKSCAKEETARKLLEKKVRGSVHSEFPEQWKEKTLTEITKAAKKGDKSAQKARKLLTDKRFRKGDNRKKGK